MCLPSVMYVGLIVVEYATMSRGGCRSEALAPVVEYVTIMVVEHVTMGPGASCVDLGHQNDPLPKGGGPR
jgi:hypothetical protein